ATGNSYPMVVTSLNGFGSFWYNSNACSLVASLLNPSSIGLISKPDPTYASAVATREFIANISLTSPLSVAVKTIVNNTSPACTSVLHGDVVLTVNMSTLNVPTIVLPNTSKPLWLLL